MAVYKEIVISPMTDLKWEFWVRNIPGDREEGHEAPSANGYMYYHTLSDKEAFQKLKECMVQRHEEEIRKLQDSLDKLKALEMEDYYATNL